MILPLQLRYRPGADPAPDAWFLPGDSATRWLDELARCGLAGVETQLFLVPLSVENRAPAGLLVVPAKAAPLAHQPAGLSCRSIAGRLFVPLDAVLHPPLADVELRTLCPMPVYFLHPAFGLSGFDESSTLRVWNLLEKPEEIPSDWNAARPGASPLPELSGVVLMQPPSLEDVFGGAENEIGSKPPFDLPPVPDEPKEGALADAQRKLGRLFVQGLAAALRLVPHTGSQRTRINDLEDWANRRLNRVNERLDHIRNKELLRLLHLLNTDPESGLRHAIPLSAFAHRGVAPPGGRLGTRSLNFDLSRLGGRAADFWDVPPDMQEVLRRRYREMADREMQLGRHRRAACIYAELLGDLVSAANTLKQGRHFREAALLYDEHLKNPLEAARCLAEGGLLAEAIEHYVRLNRWLDIADLHERLGNRAAAAEAVRRVIDERLAQDDILGAGKLLDERLSATDEALQKLLSAWPSSRQAAACVSAAFQLLARLGRHEVAMERLVQFSREPVPPALLLPLLTTLGTSARDYPCEALRHRAADFSRVLIAARLGQKKLSDEETGRLMEFLIRLAPQDRLLARDANRHLSTRRETEVRARRVTPPPPPGHKPILVRRFELPRQMEWLQLRHEWHCFYAVGVTPKRLTLIRGIWEGELQSLSWECPAQAAKNGLLFEPTGEQGRTVVLKSASGPDFAGKKFPPADTFFGMECAAGTPAWLTPQHWPAAFGEQSLWTAHLAGGRGILSCHSKQGVLRQTKDVTDELLAGAERGENTRLCLTVVGLTPAVALGNRLVLATPFGQLLRLELPGQVVGLVPTLPHTRAGLAIILEHGAVMNWLAEPELIELDRDLTSPLATFVPGGPLVLLSGSQLCLLDVDSRGVQKVTRVELTGQRPVGLSGTSSPGQFAVLGAKGEMTVYRVPQWSGSVSAERIIQSDTSPSSS